MRARFFLLGLVALDVTLAACTLNPQPLPPEDNAATDDPGKEAPPPFSNADASSVRDSSTSEPSDDASVGVEAGSEAGSDDSGTTDGGDAAVVEGGADADGAVSDDDDGG